MKISASPKGATRRCMRMVRKYLARLRPIHVRFRLAGFTALVTVARSLGCRFGIGARDGYYTSGFSALVSRTLKSHFSASCLHSSLLINTISISSIQEHVN